MIEHERLCRKGVPVWSLQNEILQSYLITIVVTDDGVPALTDSETITVLVNAPPRVVELRVNGGELQRSRVNELNLEFNDDVSASLATTDLSLVNVTTGQPVQTVDLSLSFDSLNNVATITFPGLSAGLLADGNYRLTLSGAGIHFGRYAGY